jgi:hypothetical protein
MDLSALPSALPADFEPAPVSAAKKKCEFPYFDDPERGVLSLAGGLPLNPVFVDPGRRDLLTSVNMDFTFQPGAGKADNKFSYSKRQQDHRRRKAKWERARTSRLAAKQVNEATVTDMMQVF